MFLLDVEFNYPIRHKLIVYHPFYHFKWILKMIQNFHFQKFWVIELNSYVLAELTAMVGIWAFLCTTFFVISYFFHVFILIEILHKFFPTFIGCANPNHIF